MPTAQFRIVLFTGARPRAVAGLLARIRAEAPDITVAGVLYEERVPKAFSRRVRDFLHSAGDPAFRAYAATRLRVLFAASFEAVCDRLLRFVHASPGSPNGTLNDTLAHLRDDCAVRQIPFCHTHDIHGADALAFVRRHRPDLGVVYGTRVLKPVLYDIPSFGSINIHKRKVPEYRGGGAIGLWELLEHQSELGITVHRVSEIVDTGAVVASATIPIGPFDSLVSLGLKADVLGNDLLIDTIRSFASGTIESIPQPLRGRTFKTPSPPRMQQLCQQLALLRPPYRAQRGRPVEKLLARAVLFAPYVVARNWMRRWRKSFPVTILYHHLVTDRRHCDGIPTEAFLNHVMYLRRHYRLVTMHEAIEMLKRKAVDRPTVVLTFDDGYADNFLGLRAVIEEASVPVTLFISTEVVEAGRPFAHDISSNQLGFQPLTPMQVKQLRLSGCEIGSHTRSHFDCGSGDAAALEREIVGSKNDLEAWLKEPVEYFSFPWGRPGRMSPAAVRLAKTTYSHVFSAFGGQNFAGTDAPPWHLRRSVHPNDISELELQLQGVLELGDGRIDIEGEPTPIELS